jgi:hypothetical protein
MHHKLKEANNWVNNARLIYDSSKLDPYLAPLVNSSVLHPLIVTFTTKPGDQYDRVKAYVENNGLRISSPKGWITIPFDQLPDDLSPFPAEMRKQIVEKHQTAPETDNGASRQSFTTKQGEKYNEVRVSIESDGLKVLTPDGWITVPFNQLPDDLSPFPVEMRKQIAAKRKTITEAGRDTRFLSFTTKQGKEYDQARVFMEDDGLQVLTPDGWITVSFEQLPKDLSPFPAEWREQIAAKRQTALKAGKDTSLLSFTTKKGKEYDQVRVSMEDDGLQVLSPDGWITIPFKQLPDDLSMFPAELRKQIAAKRQTITEARNDARLLSFTTKNGKAYDQVRVSLEDDGLEVLTPDGWISIPFDQLPDNLSIFPAELRKQIVAKRQTASETGSDTRWISFTTKKGKEYDQVRVSLEDDKLQVLTSDGLITVPFEQLPDDLSPFPAAWRKQISAKQKAFLAKSSAPSSTNQAKGHGEGTKGNSSKSNAALNLNSAQSESHPP